MKLMTIRQAAEALNLKRAKVSMLVTRGEVTIYDRHPYIVDLDQVKKVLDEKQQASTPPGPLWTQAEKINRLLKLPTQTISKWATTGRVQSEKRNHTWWVYWPDVAWEFQARSGQALDPTVVPTKPPQYEEIPVGVCQYTDCRAWAVEYNLPYQWGLCEKHTRRLYERVLRTEMPERKQ